MDQGVDYQVMAMTMIRILRTHFPRSGGETIGPSSKERLLEASAKVGVESVKAEAFAKVLFSEAFQGIDDFRLGHFGECLVGGALLCALFGFPGKFNAEAFFESVSQAGVDSPEADLLLDYVWPGTVSGHC